MNNNEGLCEIQGHKGINFSHVCVRNKCNSTPRLMCVKCVENNLHDHELNFYKTFSEFLEYFNKERLSQLEFRIQQSKGNQVKCDYLQKIYEEFSDLLQDQNYLNLNQQDRGIKEFIQIIVIIKLVIQDLIGQIKAEILLSQKIYEIYQYLNTANLNSMNNEQVSNLLENNYQFLEKEIQSQSEIHDLINDFDTIAFDNPNHELLQNALDKVRSLCNKLLKLNKYMNFSKDYKFKQICLYSQDQISSQGRYLAQLCFVEEKEQHILLIRDLISKKRIQFQFFDWLNKLKFDNKWKYCVYSNNNKLYCFILQRNFQFKLFKIFNLSYDIGEIQFINLNKIIITTYNQLHIQIIDFQLRKINFYLPGDKKYVSFHYGGDKQIIASLIDDIVEKKTYIYIYKELENKPFIVKGQSRHDHYTYWFEIKLFNKDSQLLTSDGYIINLWQIDYVGQNIFLLKTIVEHQHWLRFNLNQLSQTELYVIKKCQGKLEIFDQNLNFQFRIKLKLNHYQPSYVYIRNQTLLYIYGCNYVVLTKASCDYEQLQQ